MTSRAFPGRTLELRAGDLIYQCNGQEPWPEWLPVLWRSSSHFAVRLTRLPIRSNPGREKRARLARAFAALPRLSHVARWFVCGGRSPNEAANLFVIGETSKQALDVVRTASSSAFWTAPGGWEDLLLFDENENRRQIVFDSVAHERQSIVYNPNYQQLRVTANGQTMVAVKCGIFGKCMEDAAISAVLTSG